MMSDVFVSCEPQIPLPPSFSSNLHRALIRSGVFCFVDDDDAEPKTNDLVLSGAIEGSRICIIVFTIHYAKSILRLQELLKIMEYRSRKGQQVVPVFYGLDPSEVCNQSGYFGEVLLDTLERNSTDANNLLTYRTALREFSAISPRFLLDVRNKSEVIEDIVAHVTSLLDSTDLFVAEHPVGVNSRVQDLIQLINNHKSDDVLKIAIWGMAGIGKTTIAKALYNQISRNFDVRKFVPNIKIRARKDLLSILKISVKTKVPNLDSTSLMRDSHCNSKLFLVIDNVTSDLELRKILSLTRDIREYFGPGSIVIIASRVKAGLFSQLQVNHIYRVKEMDYNECVELFSWTAFSKATPERSFAGLINYAVEYCDGLPLALVAVGSVLSEKSMEEWETVLDSFTRFPLQGLWQILRESIDSVGYEKKKIFLELAYLSHLFTGTDENDISQTLQEAGHNAALIAKEIKGLEDHSLVWFDDNKFRMQCLLQDIGREMYLKESSIDPQRRPYDVFLSFRGKETRSKFLSHLHASLENAGIYVFKDDDGIPRGKNVSVSLRKAIGESKASIIILSPNYAFSRWCLQELEDIIQCYKDKTQKVLPVFYHVEPSEVRKQTGKFGQAFENLIKRSPRLKGKEQSWRKALHEVGCIAGIVIRKSR